jgi:hypothetical protein
MSNTQLKIIGGDWGGGFPVLNVIFSPTSPKSKVTFPKPWGERRHFFDWYDKLRVRDIIDVVLHTEQGQKSISGAAVGGLAGAVVAGPLGLLAGLIAAGNKTLVKFTVTFRDGRSFTAEARAKLAHQFMEAALANLANDEAAQRRAQRRMT